MNLLLAVGVPSAPASTAFALNPLNATAAEIICLDCAQAIDPSTLRALKQAFLDLSRTDLPRSGPPGAGAGGVRSAVRSARNVRKRRGEVRSAVACRSARNERAVHDTRPDAVRPSRRSRRSYYDEQRAARAYCDRCHRQCRVLAFGWLAQVRTLWGDRRSRSAKSGIRRRRHGILRFAPALRRAVGRRQEAARGPNRDASLEQIT